MSIEIEKNQIY